MKPWIVRLFVAILLVSLLASCAPAEGYVKAKTFYPAHYATDKDCQRIGNVWNCSTSTTWVPDVWTITIEKDNQSGEVPVSKAEYEKIQIGDYIVVSKLSTANLIAQAMK